MKKTILFLSVILLSLSAKELSAYPKLQGTRIVNSELVPSLTAPEHFQAGMDAFNEKDYNEALYHFRIITHNFARSRFAPESYLRQGLCEYWLGEFEPANELLSQYLKSQGTPEYFHLAVEAKFMIAEQFRLGKRKRMFSQRFLPKWTGGEMQALELYDEVASLVPCEELAAKSYFSKGQLLEYIGQIKESVHSYQTVIRYFPRHELAIDSYIAISELYRRQSELEFQNPDLLELARINVKRFEADFPKDPRINYVKKLMLQTEEIHARGLYETGRLFERKSLPDAAAVYYQNAIHQYPETQVAANCKERLEKLGICIATNEVTTP